jgi:hypothetical protein
MYRHFNGTPGIVATFHGMSVVGAIHRNAQQLTRLKIKGKRLKVKEIRIKKICFMFLEFRSPIHQFTDSPVHQFNISTVQHFNEANDQ